MTDHGDNKFIKKYVSEMTKIMKKMNPDWKESDIEKAVKKMAVEKVQNPEVVLDNNFTGENKETTLLSVVDWVYKRKPIIAGNGTFYKNQHEAMNPIATMLNDWGASRKALKKKMFAVEDVTSHEYADLDRGQQNEKINMNSYYGASGAPSSAFYSKWSGPATTLSAQSVISTTEQLFESVLADNYLFLNLTEAIEWCERVLRELDDEIDDFVKIHNHIDLAKRLSEKIIDKKDSDEDLLVSYLSGYSDIIITKLYYKNNTMEFFKDHECIRNIMLDIFENVENLNYVDEEDPDWRTKLPSKHRNDFYGKKAKDWNAYVNKMYFMDPNDSPDTIKERLELLNDYFMKYIYCRYLSIDRIYRLKNFKRRVVTVIDTDSNILSMDTLMEYIMDEIVGDKTFGRDFLHNKFIAVNAFAFMITNAVTDILLYYGKCSNIPEEYRPFYNMKNEFFFNLLVIGKAKKRYISKIMLREGNMMNPPKADIKGFDFKKATTSEYAEARFMKIIKNHILNSEEVEIAEILRDLRNFKKEIRESISNGERTFLPNGNAKELAAYANPASEQGVRGALAWNLLNPDNQIEFPAKISLLKMNLFKEEDMEPLKKTNPDVWKILHDGVFNDTTEMFVNKTWESEYVDYVDVKNKKWFENIPKKYRAKYKKLGPVKWNDFVDKYAESGKENTPETGKWIVKSKGLQVLAIPSNATIPEWALDYVDWSTMINNIIAPFNAVLEIFGPQFVEEGKTVNSVNRKSSAFTNIIKF